jgi:4-amino-4-deoxy-L-arabinose transferase-like glycosyltransferase
MDKKLVLSKRLSRPLVLLGKRVRLSWLAAGVIALLFLGSRLVNLMILPMFVDEGIHLYWAQQMWLTGDFLHGTEAGKYLYIWLLLAVINWTENPLIAARVLSVFIGLAGGCAVFGLARTLWPAQRRSAWVAVVIYLILPFPVIIERMALADSLLTALTTGVLILSLQFIRHPHPIRGYALGVCLGLVCLTKLNGFIYFVIPLLAALLLIDNQKYSLKILAKPYLISLLVILPIIIDVPKQFLSVVAHSLPNPTVPNLPATTWWLYGLGETWLDLTTYVTWPILLLAMMRLGYDLWTGKRIAFLLTMLLLLTPAVYTLLGKDTWFSRYLLPIVPILVVLAAQTITDLGAGLAQQTPLKSSLLWLISTCFLALLPSFIFYYQLITNPLQVSFTPIDRWQYITGWPSGYGITEVVDWLKKEAEKNGGLAVITDSYSGPTQEGARFYLGKQQPNLYWHSLNLRNTSPEILQTFIKTQSVHVVLLLNEPVDAREGPLASACSSVLKIFPKPENQSRLVIKSCRAP